MILIRRARRRRSDAGGEEEGDVFGEAGDGSSSP